MNKYQEALAIIKSRNCTLKLNHLIGSRDIANEELKDISAAIDNVIITLEKSLAIPTQEEVCKALSEYFRQEVVYTRLKAFIFINPNNNIYAYSGRAVWKNGGNIRFEHDLPHDLVVLVGKFFKGVLENE